MLVSEPAQTEVLTPVDSISKDSAVIMETLPPHIEIEKELLYDKHTLEDTYPYKDTTREFQWEKMKERLSLLESIQKEPSQWAILQNYKNRNGEAPLVKVFKRDAYKRVSDTLGVERYQSVPLYLLTDTVIPEIYGRDGSLVRIKAMDEDSKFARIQTAFDGLYARSDSSFGIVHFFLFHEEVVIGITVFPFVGQQDGMNEYIFFRCVF